MQRHNVHSAKNVKYCNSQNTFETKVIKDVCNQIETYFIQHDL